MKKHNPLLKYNPIRYVSCRTHFLDEAIKIFIEDFSNPVKGVFSTDKNQNKRTATVIAKALISHIETSTSPNANAVHARSTYQKYIQRAMPLDMEDDANVLEDLMLRIVDTECIKFKQYASFLQNGSNIFDFPSNLINLFWETDVNNVVLKDICLPFPTIYLQFGKQDGKKVHSTLELSYNYFQSKGKSVDMGNHVDFFLDGAYVTQCPKTKALQILITSSTNQNHNNNCIDNEEEVLNCILETKSDNTIVADALEEAKKKILLHKSSFIYKKVTNYNFSLNFMKDALHEGKKSAEAAFENKREYLKLIINCLLYLQSYPEEIIEDYNEEAPKNLVNQAKSTSKAAIIAQKKLHQLGYRKIKFCTINKQRFDTVEDEVIDESVLVGCGATESKNVSPHKRRAHLRKQRYGKGLENWRFVWIKETTIHKEKYQVSQNYRIYEVLASTDI